MASASPDQTSYSVTYTGSMTCSKPFSNSLIAYSGKSVPHPGTVSPFWALPNPTVFSLSPKCLATSLAQVTPSLESCGVSLPHGGGYSSSSGWRIPFLFQEGSNAHLSSPQLLLVNVDSELRACLGTWVGTRRNR